MVTRPWSGRTGSEVNDLNRTNIAGRHAWKQPGAFEDAPGVHRIPLPIQEVGLDAVNVYAIPDGDQVVLIDGGQAIPEAEDLLARGLRQIGYDLRDVREFLVTHVHRDHYTQAVALRRRFGSKVGMGEGERAAIDALQSLPGCPDVAALQESGAPELAALVEQEWRPPNPSEFDPPDRWFPDSLEIPLTTRRLRVIATPGHTRGHVVFHDPDAGCLFGGDHLLPHITPSIGVEIPHWQHPESPLRDYLDSLRLMTALPDLMVLPAHGPAGFSSHARVAELIRHHENRLEQTLNAVERGASTAYEVARALRWTRHERPIDDLNLFNQSLAVRETAAHLEVLAERGSVVRQPGPVIHYERPVGQSAAAGAGDPTR